ncbi:MAG TPA: RNA pseudouridine synthase, partial [Rhizobiales bacterium]|nr:RNA pseudouridine synthase [Hyphomicrobiales bacterium]
RHNRLKMAVVRTGGRHAVTHYSVDEVLGPASLVTCTLETGRTHQIRVHMAHTGHPLVGDKVYGSGFQSSARKLSEGGKKALEKLSRQALHACKLGFVHPKSGARMNFESALPDDIKALIQQLKQ